MLRLWMKVVAALAATTIAASPAGTAEQVYGTHLEPTGSLRATEA